MYAECTLLFQMWDIRRKSWIFTYKGHRITVNSLKFSPDGQWIASGGEDGLVKVTAVILMYRYLSPVSSALISTCSGEEVNMFN
jgi:WD40 repeat protein